MEPSEGSQAPPQAVERMSPSLSLLRQMAGINQRAHETFMSRVSQCLSHRGTPSSMSISTARGSYRIEPHGSANENTLVAHSPTNTPSLRYTPKESPVSSLKVRSGVASLKRASPAGVESRGPSNDGDHTRTPTRKPGAGSLLTDCIASCSSLRFNPASLVPLPFGFCNNTFVKIKVGDVFDPRVGRKRTKNYQNVADSPPSAQPGLTAKRVPRQVSKAPEDERLEVHNDYAMNPYKRRYQQVMNKRRRVQPAREAIVEEVSEASPESATKLERRLSRNRPVEVPEPKEEMAVEVPEPKEEMVVEEDENWDWKKEEGVKGAATAGLQAPPPLREEHRVNVQNVAVMAKTVSRRHMDRMIDVVKIATVLRPLVMGEQGGEEASARLLELCKDAEALGEMAGLLRSLLRETQHNIMVLQYSKQLLNWHFAPKEASRGAGEGGETYRREVEPDPELEQPTQAAAEGSVHVTRGRGVLTASPCVTFHDGLTCAQGLCSTSQQSFDMHTLTDCYTAAGCYLWEPELQQKSLEPAVGNTTGHGDDVGEATGANTSVGTPNRIGGAQRAPAEWDEGNSSGENTAKSEGSEDEGELGKTGPWTSDVVFAGRVRDSNRKTQFNSMIGFLRDVCRIAMAEVRIPKPDWKGANEQACANELCCPRCCTCRETTNCYSSQLGAVGRDLSKESEAVRFEAETATAKTEMLATMLGKCVCLCKCVSDRRLVDRVVSDYSSLPSGDNRGIVWHDLETNEQCLEAEQQVLQRESVVQERFTLRIKADSVPIAWKKRSPFICKLDLVPDGVDQEGYPGGVPSGASRGDDSGVEADLVESDCVLSYESTIGSSSHESDRVVDGMDSLGKSSPWHLNQHNGDWSTDHGAKRRPLLLVKDCKELVNFTFWDAVDLLSKNQKELHSVLREGELTDWFDPLEIDISKLRGEKLKLSSDCIISDPKSEAYVEIALYLPYVPSSSLPWRFESVDPCDLLVKRFKRKPEVEVKRSLNVVVDDAGQALVGPGESDAALVGDIGGSGAVVMGPQEGMGDHTPTAPKACKEESAGCDNPLSLESTNGAVPVEDASTLVTASSTPSVASDAWNGDVVELNMPMLYAELLREMVVVPLNVRRVLQIMRDHILLRNGVLKREAEACKAYRRVWHRSLRRLRASLPKVDEFAWGVLPVRAIDRPDQFVPLPAGYKQNDISWPYTNNNVLSPFDVEGYGIGDIYNRGQRFSAMGHNAQGEKRRDGLDKQQVHTNRKPAVGRRRGAPEAEVTDQNDEESSRATVWLAPHYSNLTGPGIRWTYSCIDTLSEPLHCVPDFKTRPIYKLMSSPDYSFYQIEHCVQYDRRNALSPEALLAEEATGRISNVWTRNECRIFVEKYLMYPKNFAKIAQFIETKRCSDCVSFYYRFKYRLKLKERLKDMKARPKNKYEMSRFARRDMHVMQALDGLLDDCYTDSVRGLCEQNSFIFTTVNDHLLSPGGVDTGIRYEVALTEHRSNWSPMEDQFQMNLDNLHEGYFVPRKFRCLITRKHMELPMREGAENDATTLKRGCLVLNGFRNFGDPQQLTSVVSALKAEHFMTLKPIYSRRVTGRSVLESVMYNIVKERSHPQQVMGGVYDLGAVPAGSAQDIHAASEFEISDIDHVEYHNDLGVGGSMAYVTWGATERKGVVMDTESTDDHTSPPTPQDYEVEAGRAYVVPNYSEAPPMIETRFGGRAPVAAAGRSMPLLGRQFGVAGNAEMARLDPEMLRLLSGLNKPRKKRAAKAGGAAGMYFKYKRPRGRKAKNYDKATARAHYEAAMLKPITEWSEAEVAEFVRLFHIHGEDWDAMEKDMKHLGKSKEHLINYYVTRLTNNALRREMGLSSDSEDGGEVEGNVAVPDEQ
ncbi:Myb family DNA-binding domain-containing protein [Babesia caballi]|uniref:Myb family DNA-binding domain-containing protein n=1 Tax=Babesia caballi TaxID=5871 RepID=A0AAV4LYU1_BABCB|nr:Myb family DNA-binding domain-containing protein [Babesia caballi]